MKTMSKTNKAIVLALVVAMLFVATAVVLTACKGDKDGITKYDATFTANVTMGSMGTYSMASVFDSAYVTKEDGKYTLTLIFKVGEIEVNGAKGSIFVDDNPANATTVDGVKDGTIGVYDKDGNLVTEGVKVTYSSGEDYVVNTANAKVYYVKSASFPVASLTEEYGISLYVNSAMKGFQFAKGVNPATVKLDLKSGEVVKEINGFGVAERGTVAGEQPSNPSDSDENEDEVGDEVGDEEVVITKYDATLTANVTMGPMGTYNMGTVLDGAYVTKEDEKYTLTLIFKEIAITVGQNDYPASLIDYEEGNTGYYNGDTLVTDGIELTYSTGFDYITVKLGSYPNQVTKNVYYLKSMSFEVDSVEDTYDLALYLGSSAMSAQFDKDGTNATLAIDLESGEEVEKISGMGVSVCGTAPEEDSSYLQYDATLSCLVTAMGFEFGTGLLDGAYLSQENGENYITLIFKKNVMNIMGSTATAFVDDSATGAIIGIYKEDGTLVTDGVELTYSTGDDFVSDKTGNKLYYVKSARFALESLQEEIRLSLYVNSNTMGYQFSEAGKYPAVLTLDLSECTAVDSINDLLGVATRGEVEAE